MFARDADEYIGTSEIHIIYVLHAKRLDWRLFWIDKLTIVRKTDVLKRRRQKRAVREKARGKDLQLRTIKQ